MKLASVTFKHIVSPPGVSASADFQSPPVPLEYDRATDMVRVGNDPVDVPRADVAQWKRIREKDTAPVRCNVCLREFNNTKALGAHKAFKHRVEVG